MAYPKEIMDKAFETLAERRSQARNDYQYRLQVIREKAPAVEELRRELTGTSAAIAQLTPPKNRSRIYSPMSRAGQAAANRSGVFESICPATVLPMMFARP